jgi:hypothetical protein
LAVFRNSKDTHVSNIASAVLLRGGACIFALPIVMILHIGEWKIDPTTLVDRGWLDILRSPYHNRCARGYSETSTGAGHPTLGRLR